MAVLPRRASCFIAAPWRSAPQMGGLWQLPRQWMKIS
jgi:hypothetical protein